MVGKFVKVRENWYEILDKILVEKVIHKYENGDHAKYGYNYGDPQNVQGVISVNKYLCLSLNTGKTVIIDPDDIVEVQDKIPVTVVVPETIQSEIKQIKEISFEEIKQLNNK